MPQNIFCKFKVERHYYEFSRLRRAMYIWIFEGVYSCDGS